VHVPFQRLDRGRLEVGMGRLLSAPVRRGAASLGDAIRTEGNGTERAARLLDEWLADAEPVTNLEAGRTSTSRWLSRVPA
jgi:hypothetical protein